MREDALHRQDIKAELAKTKVRAKDPNAMWLNEDEFWAEIEDDL